MEKAPIHGGLFGVLNKHASMIARGEVVTVELETSFRNFLLQVQENWLVPPDPDPDSELGRSYFEFLEVYDSCQRLQ